MASDGVPGNSVRDSKALVEAAATSADAACRLTEARSIPVLASGVDGIAGRGERGAVIHK